MRPTLTALLNSAKAEGWTRTADALPPKGERVDVMHILNRSYDCIGEIDEAGQWACANGFILPNMVLTFTPTHWRARAEGQP